VRLLAYFGEASTPCGNCDNCLNPPAVWDATDAARKLLSTIYRVHQASGISFGAGHIMDMLRGKRPTRWRSSGTKALHLRHWRRPDRAAAARRAAPADRHGRVGLQKVMLDSGHSFDTLCLTEGSRAVLKGEVPVQLRESVGRRAQAHAQKQRPTASRRRRQPGPDAQVRFINLKAWRAEVAREHNLPAYVIFHDATLAAIAERCPRTLDDLQGISGMGAKKLEAYGAEVLRVCALPLWAGLIWRCRSEATCPVPPALMKTPPNEGSGHQRGVGDHAGAAPCRRAGLAGRPGSQ
jgi:ATP-dependent DNA helicase RecQ